MATDNVIKLGMFTRLDIDPNGVLDGAKDKCKKVLVLGCDIDDNLYVAGSTANVGELLRLIETFKFKLMNGDFN